MSALTQFQIELIRGDIRQNGVELLDLEEDLLDHICCTMEEEDLKVLSFEELYQNIKKKICPNGYREIQEATNYLITQKYFKMKKSMNVLGTTGSALLLVGSIMKLLRLVASNEMLVLGAALIVFGYLPLMLILSLKQTDSAMGKFRNISGYAGANLVVIGIVLHVLHWSYGKELLIAGFLIFLIIFVPLFFRSVGKDAMMKVQPVTLSVLLIAIVSSLFAFSLRRPSTAYINSLLAINSNMEKAYDLKYDRLIKTRNAKSELSEVSSNTLNYIDELKRHLVSTVDEKSIDDKLNIYNIFIFDTQLNDILMYNNGSSPNGKKLENHVQKFVSTLQNQNPELMTILSNRDEGKTWLETHFMDKPLYGVYTTLTNFQLEIVSLEMEAINSK
ncbi:MAG: hypothetical protein OEW67_06330 [Cyclobacteriaceae bacterium]|nr:hypothetical protein [Cyclobacteriaceae bacterium]